MRGMPAVPSYPVSLVVDGRDVLVVGGGTVAARKASSFAECGAKVTVIAPELCRSMVRLVEGGRVTARLRGFSSDDVEGMPIVVAATDDADVNAAVYDAARAAGALVNVADDPPRCDFIAPSVIRRGLLSVAVSTSGASPALARRIREQLESVIDEEWDTVTAALSAFREGLLDEALAALLEARDLGESKG